VSRVLQALRPPKPYISALSSTKSEDTEEVDERDENEASEDVEAVEFRDALIQQTSKMRTCSRMAKNLRRRDKSARKEKDLGNRTRPKGQTSYCRVA
jgi:hypothetical protein